MGFVTRRISDLTGAELSDEQVVSVVIRNHPAADGDNKVFDTSAEELKALKTVDGLIELEVKTNGGTPTTVFCTSAELGKLVTDEKIKGFDSARGRRSNWRPGANGN